jgi:hypothetical protein
MEGYNSVPPHECVVDLNDPNIPNVGMFISLDI